MDHLECLLNEYLTIQGYIVVCNAKVGKLGHISYCSPEMEPAVSHGSPEYERTSSLGALGEGANG